MKRTRWIALCAAAALILGLCAACDGNPEPSPTITAPSETTPSSQTTPPAETTPPAKTTPPSVTMKPVTFPDIDGFVKTVVEDVRQARYESDAGSIVLDFFPATAAQLAEASGGWGSELEALLIGGLTWPGTFKSDSVVDLPGLGRKGLEVELDLAEGFYVRGLIFPLDDSLYAAYAVCSDDEAAKQTVLDALDQLKQNLTV